jgi:hypothetical protein
VIFGDSPVSITSIGSNEKFIAAASENYVIIYDLVGEKIGEIKESGDESIIMHKIVSNEYIISVFVSLVTIYTYGPNISNHDKYDLKKILSFGGDIVISDVSIIDKQIVHNDLSGTITMRDFTGRIIRKFSRGFLLIACQLSFYGDHVIMFETDAGTNDAIILLKNNDIKYQKVLSKHIKSEREPISLNYNANISILFGHMIIVFNRNLYIWKII